MSHSDSEGKGPMHEADPNSMARWDAAYRLPAARSNWNATLAHRTEAMAVAALLPLLTQMGRKRASAFMGTFLRILGPLLRPVQRRGLENLALIYPEKSKTQRKAILAQVWENLGRNVGEYPFLPTLPLLTPDSPIHVENEDRLRTLIADHKQIIFVSAHMGNWEVMSMILFRMGVRFAFVYRAANNPIMDAQIIAHRARVTSRLQIPKGKSGARDIIGALKNGLSLCMLVDQKLNHGVRVPFMGHEAMTSAATARLALKFDLPVIPLAIRRREHDQQVFSVYDPIAFVPSGKLTADVTAYTALINQALTHIIQEDPGQWLWLHRRWPECLHTKQTALTVTNQKERPVHESATD